MWTRRNELSRQYSKSRDANPQKKNSFAPKTASEAPSKPVMIAGGEKHRALTLRAVRAPSRACKSARRSGNGKAQAAISAALGDAAQRDYDAPR